MFHLNCVENKLRNSDWFSILAHYSTLLYANTWNILTVIKMDFVLPLRLLITCTSYEDYRKYFLYLCLLFQMIQTRITTELSLKYIHDISNLSPYLRQVSSSNFYAVISFWLGQIVRNVLAIYLRKEPDTRLNPFHKPGPGTFIYMGKIIVSVLQKFYNMIVNMSTWNPKKC